MSVISPRLDSKDQMHYQVVGQESRNQTTPQFRERCYRRVLQNQAVRCYWENIIISRSFSDLFDAIMNQCRYGRTGAVASCLRYVQSGATGVLAVKWNTKGEIDGSNGRDTWIWICMLLSVKDHCMPWQLRLYSIQFNIQYQGTQILMSWVMRLPVCYR